MIALFVFFKSCPRSVCTAKNTRVSIWYHSGVMSHVFSDIRHHFFVINCLKATPSWLRMWCWAAIRWKFIWEKYTEFQETNLRKKNHHRFSWNLMVGNLHGPFGVPYDAKARFRQFLTTYERFSRKRGREGEIGCVCVCWGFSGF